MQKAVELYGVWFIPAAIKRMVVVITVADCLRDYRKKSEIVEDSVSCTLKHGQRKGEIYGTWGI